MPIPKTNLDLVGTGIKGMRDISTHANEDNIDQTCHPSKTFMRLACIEMEKTRLEKEKESAGSRQKNTDIRLQKIDKEKTMLLEAVSNPDVSISSVREQTVKPKRNGGGFKVKY